MDEEPQQSQERWIEEKIDYRDETKPAERVGWRGLGEFVSSSNC